MKKVTLILIIAVISTDIAFSQCNITAYGNGDADTVEICIGDSVALTSVGGCTSYCMYDDFNNGTFGPGWSSVSQAMFNNPCAPHSPDGSIYLWLGSSSTAPRYLVTNNCDVSFGGSIDFEMRYAVQSAASPCEGPDEFDEGIAIQYSINNGTTWNTIEYYAPNGQVLNYIPTSSTPGATGQTPFTVWTTRTVPIPPAAMTAATSFRWAQTASTSEVYDHWGIDNVEIHIPHPIVTYWWAHGPTEQNPPLVYPTQNTTYTVFMTDGLDTIQSSVNVVVKPKPTSTFSVSTPVCAGTPATITYTGTASSSAQYYWDFDGGTVIGGTGQGPYQLQWDNQGAYNLALWVSSDDCWSDITTDSINAIACSSIENPDNSIIDLYTAPSGCLIIKTNKYNNHMSIKLLNINGQLLYKQTIVQPVTEINIQSLAKGMYFIHVEKEGKNMVRKFVKE